MIQACTAGRLIPQHLFLVHVLSAGIYILSSQLCRKDGLCAGDISQHADNVVSGWTFVVWDLTQELERRLRG